MRQRVTLHPQQGPECDERHHSAPPLALVYFVSFLVVTLTASGMNYDPEMEGTPLIQTLSKEDKGF